MRKFLIMFVLCFFIILIDSRVLLAQSLPSSPSKVDSTLRYVPEDKSNILSCIGTSLNNRFPFDIFRILDTKQHPGNISQCPEITLFFNTYQACFILDILHRIEPFIILGLSSYAIFHL